MPSTLHLPVERDGLHVYTGDVLRTALRAPIAFSQRMHRPGRETAQPSGGQLVPNLRAALASSLGAQALLRSQNDEFRLLRNGYAKSLRAPAPHLFRIKGAQLL